MHSASRSEIASAYIGGFKVYEVDGGIRSACATALWCFSAFDLDVTGAGLVTLARYWTRRFYRRALARR